MNVNEARLRQITQKILLEMLKDGTIPSAPTLVRAQQNVLRDRNPSNPLSDQPREGVWFRESASSSKLNRMLNLIVDDLDVLYDSFLDSEQKIEASYFRALAELKRIDRETKSLLGRVNRLLLTEKNTEGFLLTVGDDFVDASKVDQDLTTAIVDLSNQAVHGAFVGDLETRFSTLVDLDRIEEGDITVRVLTPDARGGQDSAPRLNMLNQDDEPWIYRCSTGEAYSGPVSIEVRIDFGSVISAAKLGFQPFITNNSVLILAQYSSDNLTWKDIPVQNPLRRVVGPSLYLFPPTSFQYLRIVLTKDVHDAFQSGNGRKQFTFGLSKLEVFGIETSYENECELVSEMLYATDADGNYENFTQASLSLACEDLPGETDIEYSIAFKIPDELNPGQFTQSEFFVVAPLNRNDRSKPLTVSVTDIEDSESIYWIGTIDAFANENDIDHRILDLGASDPPDSFQLWRNPGDNSYLYTVASPTGEAIEQGWSFDGFRYSCFFYIDEENGQEFDFGPTRIEIDGAIRTGAFRLTQGIHFAKTEARNWYSLSGLARVRTFSPATKTFTGTKRSYGEAGEGDWADGIGETANYQVIDPLYPYNHKLIIEGLDYTGEFDDQLTRNRYAGVTRYAAQLMIKVDQSYFDNDVPSDNYSIYTIVPGEDTGTRRTYICVKWIQPGDDDPRERFAVVSRTATYAQGVVLKAKFITHNPSRTATLEGYEIRISK
jgi:hypothetical protein